METEETTLETQGGEAHMTPSPVEKASTAVAQEAMTLEELNTFLGKNFKDKASALQSLRELNSYVGKKKEDILAEVTTSNNKLAEELKIIKENQFYDRNPELKDYRGIISRLGDNPEEVVKMPEFKDIFTKAKGYDETVKLKTVLESNPRLAQSRDNITKARDIISKNQISEREKMEAEQYALDAVKEAFDL